MIFFKTLQLHGKKQTQQTKKQNTTNNVQQTSRAGIVVSNANSLNSKAKLFSATKKIDPRRKKNNVVKENMTFV